MCIRYKVGWLESEPIFYYTLVWHVKAFQVKYTSIFISRQPIGPVREIIKCPLSVRACVRSSRFYKSLSISKTIIARASKFAGYIHHWKNLPGNLFLLILKNKMAATGVNKMAAVDFFSTLSKGLIAQKVLQLQLGLPQVVILLLEYSLTITLLLNEYSFLQLNQENVPFHCII